MLEALRAALRAKLDEREATRRSLTEITDAVSQRGETSFTDEETKRFNEARDSLAKLDEEKAALEARISELEGIAARDAAADEARQRITPANAPATGLRVQNAASIGVGAEPRTYDEHPGRYLVDILTVNSNPKAQERLNRHVQEMQVEQRDVGRSTDAELGYFVPPLYAIGDWADVVRAGRPFADAIGPKDLPDGVDAVKVPMKTTGTKVAAQDGDNTAITTRDIVTTETTASLVTIAGHEDISVQALERAPLDMQDMVFQDLLADYAVTLDTYLWTGTGANGQPLGVLNAAVGAVNSTTYTDTNPTVGELYPKLGEAIGELHDTRKLPAQAIFMTPTRWAWISSAVDTSGRPLAGWNDTLGSNVPAYIERVAPEGRGGRMQNLPVILDSNIPATATAGAGTTGTEDKIVVVRLTDLRLWEGAPRMRVYPIADATSDTLTTRIEFYRYVMFLPGRYPKALSIISGTGLAAPTF